MKRRLNLAVALLPDPILVLADEPTVGVDPQSRNHIFESIQELADNGKSVVYTTHYMEEVERLCKRAAIIDHGRVMAMDNLDELRKLAQPKVQLRLKLGQQPVAESTLVELTNRFQPVSQTNDQPWLGLRLEADARLGALIGWLEENGHPVLEVHSERPSLEDAFLKLTGRSLRDG
jgi:ABC-2 type transport system ATP-binding protein